ncbi:MAG: hypothetical protein F4Y45_05740 [Acidobacteria bacterium]|nr:hypothetical protein [Acidobacteriota bacterium]MYJ04616.1 hypothetical protein [Acidobacteriota bacterium]
MKSTLGPALLCVALLGTIAAAQQVADAPPPVAARNDVARPLGPEDEVLMLRHQYLARGTHEMYYRASAYGVWPWFEQIGARIVGQWQVVHPDGGAGHPEFDEGYRLARYASFEHWQQTRGPASNALGGNGPNRLRNNEALRIRQTFARGSEGGYFLQGLTATTRPRYLPGVSGEAYEQIDAGAAADPADELIAVRRDADRGAGRELITLTYRRIRAGSFRGLLDGTVSAVWPFEEKLGARPMGQWQVLHPEGAASRTEPSGSHDEMITMTRYAGYDHYLALQPGRAVLMGGNGPDWQAWRDAARAIESATLESRVEFLEGYFHDTPPTYMPPLPERYRRSDAPAAR